MMLISSFLVITVPLLYALSFWPVLASAIALVVLVMGILLAWKRKLFVMEKSLETKRWRVAARPFAMLFIPIEIYAGHRFLLYLMGVVSMIFIGIDLYRLITRRQMSIIFKKKEFQRFSSMTSFMVATFIVFLLFPSEIVYLCLAFIIFGDMSAKLIGLRFGRTRIIHEKTLEGSLGFLSGCLYSGFILCTLFQIGFPYLVIGALFATFTELFSYHMDDNFTVGILTGGCLQALEFFQVI